jgi:hypothetical protein
MMMMMMMMMMIHSFRDVRQLTGDGRVTSVFIKYIVSQQMSLVYTTNACLSKYKNEKACKHPGPAPCTLPPM